MVETRLVNPMRRALFLAACLATLGVTSPSRAEMAEPEWSSPDRVIGGDLWWGSAKNFGSAFALVPYIAPPLTDKLTLDIRVPITFSVLGGGTKTLRGGLG